MIKHKLKLKNLELNVPTISKDCVLKSARGQAQPFAPCRIWLAALEKLKGKSLRTEIAEKYTEVFGVFVPENLTWEAARARIAYRLQIEGHRIAGLEPPAKLLSNYNAIMHATDAEPFEGLDPDTAFISNMNALQEGASAVKPKKKVAVKKKASKPSTRAKIYDTYSMCAVARFLAHKKIERNQIVGVLERLLGKLTPQNLVTISTVCSDVKAGLFKPEALNCVTKEDFDRLKKLVPPATAKHEKEKISTPHKRVPKKVVKVGPPRKIVIAKKVVIKVPPKLKKQPA